MGAWDGTTRDTVSNILIVVGGTLTLIFASCFVLYVLIGRVGVRCHRRWERRQDRETGTDLLQSESYRTAKKFTNANTRLLLAFTATCALESINRMLSISGLPISHTTCVVRGIIMQFTDWIKVNYILAIAIWLYVHVFFGRKIRSLPNRSQVTMELATHVLCLLGAAIWVLIPLSTYPWFGLVYGPAGIWCWMVDDEHGQFWRMAGLYFPLWSIIIIILVLYLSILIFVVRAYNTMHVHETRGLGLRPRNYLSRFGHQIFLVIRSKKGDRSLIRLSYEWKAYFRAVLHPGLFLLVWIAPTMNRVQQLFGYSLFPIQVLHLLSVPLHGTFTVLIYPIDPVNIIVFVRRLICCEMKSKEEEMEGEEMEMIDDRSSRAMSRELVRGYLNFETESDENEEDYDKFEDTFDDR